MNRYGRCFPSAKVIITDPYDTQRILLIKRNGYYEPVGGKLEVDFTTRTAESLEACAVREAREELGVAIVIQGYVGSYYFFWSIDPEAFSSCAVFAGVAVQQDMTFATNADTTEYAVSPVWVTRSALSQGAVHIDPLFVGLSDVFGAYCNKF